MHVLEIVYTNTPMSFTLLIIFMFVAFGLTTLFRKWIDIPTLIAVAIGCACNSNLYTAITHPIVVGPFTFSFEIVLYTLFMYTIMIRILDYGYNAAKVMTFTSIAAILISAIIELIVTLSMNGASWDVFKTFLYYVFSFIGTLFAVWFMIFITIFLRKMNVNTYFTIAIALVTASVIHALFFYGGIALLNWNYAAYPWSAVLGNLVGKAVCIPLAVFCYFINVKWWKPNNLKILKEERA